MDIRACVVLMVLETFHHRAAIEFRPSENFNIVYKSTRFC